MSPCVGQVLGLLDGVDASAGRSIRVMGRLEGNRAYLGLLDPCPWRVAGPLPSCYSCRWGWTRSYTCQGLIGSGPSGCPTGLSLGVWVREGKGMNSNPFGEMRAETKGHLKSHFPLWRSAFLAMRLILGDSSHLAS